VPRRPPGRGRLSRLIGASRKSIIGRLTGIESLVAAIRRRFGSPSKRPGAVQPFVRVHGRRRHATSLAVRGQCDKIAVYVRHLFGLTASRVAANSQP